MTDFKQTTTRELVLGDDCAGLRLDQALTGELKEFSRARVQEWIRQGAVSVDGGRRKPNHKVIGGEYVTVQMEIEADERWAPQALPIEPIYQDDDLLVIDKPAGLVVHPGAGNRDGTLINGLLHSHPELASVPRCGIVHRIDKDTSGLLVVARSSRAHRALVDQLSRHEVQREYQAVVLGALTGGGRVDAPIGRHPRHRVRMAVVGAGRPALTHYRIARHFRHFTHVDVRLETGRTHQIRVHMAHIHHPLVGDPLYGGRQRLAAGLSERLREAIGGFPRQALHAVRLSLKHPGSEEPMHFESRIAEDIEALLERLKEEDSL